MNARTVILSQIETELAVAAKAVRRTVNMAFGKSRKPPRKSKKQAKKSL
jgi:hypothetical protein